MHYPSSAKRASYFYTASSVICVDYDNNEGPGNLLLERKLVFVDAFFIFFWASTFFIVFSYCSISLTEWDCCLYKTTGANSNDLNSNDKFQLFVSSIWIDYRWRIFLRGILLWYIKENRNTLFHCLDVLFHSVVYLWVLCVMLACLGFKAVTGVVVQVLGQ